jgi:hypothetical protein
LAAALALRTGDRLRARRCAVSAARFTRDLSRNLNRRFDALGGFVERDLEVVAQVGAALWTAAPPAAAAEDIAKAEDVAKATEDVFEAAERVGIESAGRRAAEPGVTEAVVHMPLVGVDQNRVRLGSFLEPLFGFFVARIAVGMEFQRELPVRALDLLFRRRLGDAQDLVVIAFAHARLATFTMAGRSSRSPTL